MEFDAFGRYSVLKDETGAPAILGHGVWGTVHKAFNHDLRCYAALRIIARSAFQSDEVREQFIVEVRSAAHISHSSLARGISAGIDRGQISVCDGVLRWRNTGRTYNPRWLLGDAPCAKYHKPDRGRS